MLGFILELLMLHVVSASIVAIDEILDHRVRRVEFERSSDGISLVMSHGRLRWRSIASTRGVARGVAGVRPDSLEMACWPQMLWKRLWSRRR